jgi:hypothetical protein
MPFSIFDPFGCSVVTARALFLRGAAAIFAVAFASLYDQLPGLVGPNGLQPLTSAAGSGGGPLLPLLSSALHAPLDVTLELTCAAGTLVAAASAFTGVVNGLLFLVMFTAFHVAQSAFGTFTAFQVSCRPVRISVLTLVHSGTYCFWRWALFALSPPPGLPCACSLLTVTRALCPCTPPFTTLCPFNHSAFRLCARAVLFKLMFLRSLCNQPITSLLLTTIKLMFLQRNRQTLQRLQHVARPVGDGIPSCHPVHSCPRRVVLLRRRPSFTSVQS